ncbi:nuclear transport factor 2 family protein [Microbulbifer sp. 2201CG32-9]|uniref:nuclear transport factor 2 family protein n=1 Tax=Microbulbifer sp. 2201CG32-9 TaxID=3232309 RepID=UPI00345BE239
MFRSIAPLIITGLCILSRHGYAQEHPVIAGPAVSPQLTAEITNIDRIFFDAVFNNCDLEASRNLITADFEMYHDKWGKTASSGAEFLRGLERMCQRRKDGSDIRARRQLVAEGMRVYPLNKFGAIQTGTHLFYGIRADNTEVLRESGQFTHVWQKVDGQWKLARVLSFDHQPATGHPTRQLSD